MKQSQENKGTGIDLGGVLNALPGLVWTAGADGHCTFANRAWQDYTGLETRDGWQQAIHADDLGPLLEAWRAIQHCGVAQEIDARLRRHDGEYRWYAFQPSPLPRADGTNPDWCWLATCTDWGPTLDGRMRRLFDALPWQAGFLNLDYVAEFCNRQSLTDFNMTLEQLQKYHESGIVHVDDLAGNDEAAHATMTQGVIFDRQQRMLYPVGRYRWTRARCVPVRDAQGNVMRYVTFQIDVDDLKQAETLLEAEVELLERVATGEPLPQILAALIRHVETLCHECWCEVLLIDPDHNRFRVGAGPHLPEAFNAHLEGQVIDARHDACSLAVSDRRRIVSADVHEDPRWQGSSWTARLREHGYFGCCALPVLSGTGEVSGVIAVYRTKAVSPRPQDQDIVDRFTKIASIAIDRTSVEEGLNRARAELAHVARVATLSTMTASITHEVSQPIAGILTNASIMVRMLAADPPNLAGITETVRRTLRDANRASDVITRLRAMFNKKAPTIEAVDLNHAAREVVAVAAGELQKGHAVVEVVLEEDLPAVHGDRVQLQQVILNLILNAVDAMSTINDRPRHLLVRTERGADDSVRLSVQDSGTGFAPGAIDKLFDAFYTTKAHGMGVGLAISRSIIRNHKGELWAHSNHGPGATFVFSIPGVATHTKQVAVGDQ